MRTPIRFAMLAATAASIAAMATGASASSHREAPGITEIPKLDSTDFYMFRSYEPGREDYVTFIANYQPLQTPYGGPNYFTMDADAVYEIHIDNDGDAVEDITYQFNFTNRLANDGNGIVLNIGGKDIPIALRHAGPVFTPTDTDIGEFEFYRVDMITGDRRSGDTASLLRTSNNRRSFRKPLDNIGDKTFKDYESYVSRFTYEVSVPGCAATGRVFAGQRAEAFAVNLGEVFDLVNLVPIEGDNPRGSGNGNGFPGGITQDRANDDLIGESNVTSLAIEVPIACVVGDGNGVIGAWTTASLPQTAVENPLPSYENTANYSGAFVQQSRLSAPLVNELVIGLKDKDLFNAAEPMIDAALADYVTNPSLPAILNLLFKDAVNATLGTNIEDLAPTNFPRNDLVGAFLTGFPGFNQQATVTGSEMMRLNTGVPPTPRADQSPFGVVAEDLAGFPNGRRPGDDVVDIALRVVMGRLCHDLPLGQELSGDPNAEDNVNLGYCAPEDASVGTVEFTDGAPLSAMDLGEGFPYLNTPISGSPN